jgi:hypothetical protein
MNDRFRRGTEGPEAGARSATTTTHDDTRAIQREEHVETERRFDRDEHAPRQGREHVVEHVEHDRAHDHDRGGLTAGTMRDVRARQRDEFGGINWGASFFGWLSAMGLAAILAAIVSAAGTTLALTSDGNDANASNADTIGIAGGILLLVLLGLAYFAGGYVAGRMSRFDGARQGLGVWIIALAVTVVLAVAGAVLGAEYNVLNDLNLPNIPVDSGDLATGGLIALGLAVLVTLGAAILGGKIGERYHRKVDRVAINDHS